MLEKILSFLEQLKSESRLRQFTPCAPLLGGRSLRDGKILLDFSSNDYLGLSTNPILIESALNDLKKHGVGSRGSRLMTGSLDETLLLEADIANWKGSQSALLLGSGYMANVGLLKSLAMDRNTVFLGDKLNHASLNLGCQFSTFKRYHHNDMAHLERLLQSLEKNDNPVIVSDTVFSMDGDIAPCDDLRTLATRYNALLYLDDAHAAGLFGENGKGLAQPHSFEIAMGTCSKALGSYGAYVSCSKLLHDYFINTCGSVIYTTALPPSIYASIRAAIQFVRSEEGRKARLHVLALSELLREKLSALNFDIGHSSTPIIPIILKDNAIALDAAKYLNNKGFLVTAIRPPTVPRNTARLRLSISAAHSEDDVYALVEALTLYKGLNTCSK